MRAERLTVDTMKQTSSAVLHLESDAAGEELLIACWRAISAAALRLGVDPLQFAQRCGEGQIADLVLDLRLARHGLDPADKERVEQLLHSIGSLP